MISKMSRKINVLVTGSSSGIGLATCRKLVQDGHRVFGSVRKKEIGEAMEKEFGKKFSYLIFDVTSMDEMLGAREKLAKYLNGQQLDVLVNNAAIVIAGPIELLSTEKLRHQFEVNVIGVIHCIKVFLPFLELPVQTRGRIINISSRGGRHAVPFFSPYHMSKFSIEALSDCARRELLLKNIDVVVVAPGETPTKMWEKELKTGFAEYQGTIYERSLSKITSYLHQFSKEGIPVDTVAKMICDVATTRNPNARYIIDKKRWKYWLYGLLPTTFIDLAYKKNLGLNAENDPGIGN